MNKFGAKTIGVIQYHTYTLLALSSAILIEITFSLLTH
jgi:hypothetical protein